jgi:uroporphyrinogen-III synthase
MSRNVLLLRAPATDGPDRYELALSSKQYTPICVPVLETVLANGDELRSLIEDGPMSQNLVGVIITSARACEAWKESVRRILSDHRSVRSGMYIVGKQDQILTV